MAISETTNARMYAHAGEIGEILLTALAKAQVFIEKAHAVGIPGHAQTPVGGFVDGEAATSDVIDMVTLSEEFRALMNTTNVKRCAMARRNLA